MSLPQHIVDRLEDYLDGTLSEAGQNELTAWAAESDVRAHELAVWFHEQIELVEAARVADLCAVFEGMSFDARDRSPQSEVAPMQRHIFRLTRRSVAMAAGILAVIAAGYLLWSESISRRADLAPGVSIVAAADPSIEEKLSPAILSRVANCVWAGNTPPLRVGQDIVAGTTLHVESGLAQLVFESGAKVVLKGPCEFRVDNSMHCGLQHGSVSAEVPPRAAGFTIRGPSAEVIDLGTRFGFSVGDAGTSEVHVFQGEVISRQLNERGEVVGKEIRLRKNQAILFPGQKKEAQRLAADEAKFALEVRPLWKQDSIEPLAVDRKLALWLRASHGVQTDSRNRVVAWQDLALGDNRVANDAFQPDSKLRPRYIPDGINGLPAIRFDGKASCLTTTPMTTTDNQTIVVAFQYKSPRAGDERVGGQIINYNGPPSRFLPDVHSPGVLQLGEKIGDRAGPNWSVAAKAFVGRDSRGVDVSAGVVRSKSLGTLQPRVVAYTYNNAENSAILYVDGKPVAKASAPTSVAVTSRKVIGKHGIFNQWYFHGDLSELLIYNTALRPNEVKELSRHLMNYYGIPQDVKDGQQL